MITFGHSGGLGDIIYSLKIIKQICDEKNNKAILYVKRYNHYNNTVDNFEVIEKFINSLPFIFECRSYPGELPVEIWGNDIKLEYNLDNFRKSLNLFENHLIKCLFVGLKLEIPLDWNRPWITTEIKDEGYILINRTSRYHNSKCDWNEIVNSTNKEIFFIGLEKEYEDFQKLISKQIKYVKTNDLFEVFNLIKNCSELWCNQSVCLTLAQAVGKKYCLEVAENHTLTVGLFTLNERLLC